MVLKTALLVKGRTLSNYYKALYKVFEAATADVKLSRSPRSCRLHQRHIQRGQEGNTKKHIKIHIQRGQEGQHKRHIQRHIQRGQEGQHQRRPKTHSKGPGWATQKTYPKTHSKETHTKKKKNISKDIFKGAGNTKDISKDTFKGARRGNTLKKNIQRKSEPAAGTKVHKCQTN